MAKKHWIYIKRGLSEDPKHRAAMGECVWLYMHIIDRADWETGIAYDWKDKEEAAEMSLPVDTLRRQRQKLEELGYIRCVQKQHNQDIYIMEWRNPRDYGSVVMNPRVQGSHERPPSLDGQGSHGQPPSTVQGGNQGGNQGSNEGGNQVQAQVQTPTSDSDSDSRPAAQAPLVGAGIDWLVGHGLSVTENDLNPALQKHKQMVDSANLVGMNCGVFADQAYALALAFQEARDIVFAQSKCKGQAKAAKSLIEQGVQPDHVRQAVKKLMDAGLTCTDLYSVERTAVDFANQPATVKPKIVRATEEDLKPTPPPAYVTAEADKRRARLGGTK